MGDIIFIDENNKGLVKPGDVNVIYYTEIKEWESNNSFRNFSIKSVYQGSVHYTAKDQNYNVLAGQYLIAAKQSDVKVIFDSKTTVRSICIDINSGTIEQALSCLVANNHLDTCDGSHFMNHDFFENVYQASNSTVGSYLNSLFFNCLYNRREIEETLRPDWFLQLAELIIFNQEMMNKYLIRIPKQKNSTKKEILRRLLTAKNFIEENYASDLKVDKIAQHCSMSEFHFYRCFKNAFHTTPHEYLADLRLLHAKKLLASRQHSLEEVSRSCFFVNSSSFTRAFKRKFQTPPSTYMKNLDNGKNDSTTREWRTCL